MMALENSKSMQQGHDSSLYGPLTTFTTYLPDLNLPTDAKQANTGSKTDDTSTKSTYEEYYRVWASLYPYVFQDNYCAYPSSYGSYYPSSYWFPQPPVQMVAAPQNYDYPTSEYYNIQDFQYFVVIDFEATCDKEKNPHPQEIIEFPSVIVNSRTGQLEDCFQIYVRPTHNQQLTDFCKDLTGIQQSQVDKGVPLSEALVAHDKWLEEKGVRHTDFAVVTWSNWDCQVMLESECRFKKIDKPAYFNQWINLKIPFGEAFGDGRCNLKEAVKRAGLTWEGRAHCGLDDAKNTARLLTLIMSHGLKLAITNTLQWHSTPGSGPYIPARRTGPIIFCHCGATSVKKVFQKPGQPKGSYFFSCGNYTATGPGCNFFKWAPDSEPVKVKVKVGP